MSDRLRGILLGALLCAPLAAGAQTVEEWRERSRVADSATAVLSKRIREYGTRRREGKDREIRAGGRHLRYYASELSAADSTVLVRGFELGQERLRARYGEAGVALIDSSAWGLDKTTRGIFTVYTLYAERDPLGTRAGLWPPISPENVADHMLENAGERLVQRTPALHRFAGSFALRPALLPHDDLARGLALSWAASGRRCAAGVMSACRTVVEPFEGTANIDRYFEPGDYRTVVAAGRLPAISDSLFFASRRRCLDGADSACVRIIAQVQAPDPFGVEMRGSVLALAIELGGHDALARIAAAPDDPPLALLARTAGIPEDSLLRVWHARTIGAVDNGPSAAVPVLLSTVAWGALLLLAASRRKFL